MYFTDKARKYAKKRCQRYGRDSDKNPFKSRQEELVQLARNPKALILIICDEAHYNATSNSDQKVFLGGLPIGMNERTF